MDLVLASNRELIHTLALLRSQDVEEFGLSVCFEKTMLELKNLVLEGIMDPKLKQHIQVRIIGKNLCIFLAVVTNILQPLVLELHF